MNELYWITRLDLINGWLIALSVICGFAIFVSLACYIGNRYDYEVREYKSSSHWMKFCAKICKISICSFFVFLCFSILTPTTKEAFMIWGVGGTIDYIKSNDKVQQLPDKCVGALDAWVESLSEDKDYEKEEKRK